MTLVSIMKEDDNPRVKIAAARALLARNTPDLEPLEQELTSDDIDAAIAAAKALLDELAARKAQSVSGPGRVADGGAAIADNAAR